MCLKDMLYFEIEQYQTNEIKKRIFFLKIK